MINLSGYGAVQSNLYVELFIDQYRTNSTSGYNSTVLRFCDKLGQNTLNGVTYLGTGALMGITQSSSDIHVSDNEMTITLSGIPNSSIGEILYSKIKGSTVIVRRAFSSATTGDLLSISGNPTIRFVGIVNKVAISEEYDNEQRLDTNTLSIVCSSTVEVFNNKISGRKTNPSSQKKFFPNDVSMDRVPNLENSYFDFGAKL